MPQQPTLQPQLCTYLLQVLDRSPGTRPRNGSNPLETALSSACMPNDRTLTATKYPVISMLNLCCSYAASKNSSEQRDTELKSVEVQIVGLLLPAANQPSCSTDDSRSFELASSATLPAYREAAFIQLGRGSTHQNTPIRTLCCSGGGQSRDLSSRNAERTPATQQLAQETAVCSPTRRSLIERAGERR